MKSFIEFINEISIATKVSAYGEMEKLAKGMAAQEGDWYGPDGTTIKLYAKRASQMLSKIRTQHGDKVAELAKQKYLKSAKREELRWSDDDLVWRAKQFKDPKVMKGGPRKGKLSKPDQDKRTHTLRIAKNYRKG